ncbi:MAG: phosphoenolpyruvate--protein phosphotransferase [Endomicrobiales bacterium]|nr:phosphoenolpyruvate--protein phosphotransferase [Endomicrobiales bacterium]
MKTLKGTTAASGIVRGVVCIYDNKVKDTVPHYNIEPNQVEREIERLKEVFEHAKTEMRDMIEKAKSQSDKNAQEIFGIHLMMLGDKGLFDKITDLIRTRNINAEHAVSDVFEIYIDKYSKAEGHFKELVHDLVDTRERVLMSFNMETGHFRCSVGEQKPVIVAANLLTPSMVLNIPREHVLAFVSREGGITSHATILARSYGVPIVFGIDVEKELDCGTNAIVDGSIGKVIISPDEKTESYYDKKIENIKKKKFVCDTVDKKVHARTKEGKNITLKLNVSIPDELNLIAGLPHDGIGLLRTEFLFIKKDEAPSEEEQYQVYRKILDEVKGPVTARILDLSNDKLPSYLESSVDSRNDLGFRGAMAVDMFRDIYVAQFKALLRANENGNLRLLYPMVADVNDINTYRSALNEAKKILKKENVKFYNKDIQEGVMVETPAAVIMADELLKNADFINVGSNDLLQYTLAASRGNALAEKRYHILHPALVRLLELVVKEGKKAKKEICLCGEAASFEEFYPLFLKIGLKSFSVSVSKFSDIKCELLHVKELKDREMLDSFYKIKSKEEAEKYFAKFV